MTLIEGLLLLPRGGDSITAGPDLAAALAAGSARFVGRHADRWFLMNDGRRFLAQFRTERSAVIGQVAVRLVIESNGPVFHLVCDTGSVLRVSKTDLRRSLHEIQRDNPDVKIVFDFRRSGQVS